MTGPEGADRAALAEAMKADEQFIQGTIEGMKQIEEGDNTTVTLEALKESVRSGKPITLL